ncbi:hypothetical protein RYX36_000962 [Vicia faba]
MAIESQARGRGVSEDTFNDCVKNIDCVRKWHCDLGLVPLCIKATCTHIHVALIHRGTRPRSQCHLRTQSIFLTQSLNVSSLTPLPLA